MSQDQGPSLTRSAAHNAAAALVTMYAGAIADAEREIAQLRAMVERTSTLLGQTVKQRDEAQERASDAAATTQRWKDDYAREAQAYAAVYSVVEEVREAMPRLREAGFTRLVEMWDAASKPYPKPGETRVSPEPEHVAG
jgi:phosphoglycolate phosphatase-like HAD superfamily hydrolase